MNIVPLSPSNLDLWNEIVADSPEAWFWHTPQWLGFAKAIGGETFVADLSFLIFVDGVAVAACPVIVEDRQGYRRFTYLGEFIPVPAFRRGVTATLRAKALAFYAGWLDATAAERSVGYTRVILPVLSEAALENDGGWNPLVRHGYLEMAAASQVLTLAGGVEELWHAVRKGHRSDVKRAAQECTVRVWDAATVTPSKFDEYRTLHAVDAGRVTRATTTFDMMLAWIRQGHAILVEAERDGRPAAFAIVIVFRGRAYYASACKDPQVALPAMHLLQWETIKGLKAAGVTHYDIGMQYFGPAWHVVPSPKDLSIAAFKRGFGGTTRRISMAEKFYSEDVLKQVADERLRALLVSREQHTR